MTLLSQTAEKMEIILKSYLNFLELSNKLSSLALTFTHTSASKDSNLLDQEVYILERMGKYSIFSLNTH